MNIRQWAIFLLFGLALASNNFLIGHSQKANTNDDFQILAVINESRVITQEEIDLLIGPQLYTLQEKIYNLRKAALNSLIAKILLEEEAKSKNITVEALKKQMILETIKIEQSRIDQIFLENINGFGTMVEDEAKERIRLDLEGREKLKEFIAALSVLRSKARVDIFLTEPILPLVSISTEAPSKGSKSATVTIIEFSDFQCPYCKQAAGVLKEVLKTYGENVKLVFKHLPLPVHQEAFISAQASVCADNQGKFWEFHDYLFNSTEVSVESLRNIAIKLKLNIAEFDSCINSEASRTAVLRDLQEARQVGIQSTPTFVINNQVLRGFKSLEEFKQAIDLELQQNKVPDRERRRQ